MNRFTQKTAVFVLSLLLLLTVLGFVVPYNSNGYNRAFFVKDSILQHRNERAIVLVGGSNVAFGFYSKLIEDSLKRKVINAGVHADIGLELMINQIAARSRKGDVVVICPEYSHFYNKVAYGGQPLADLFYLSPGLIQKYLSNQGQVKTILANTPAFLKSKLEFTAIKAAFPRFKNVYQKSGFNMHGDMVAHWNEKSEAIKPVYGLGEAFNRAFIQYFFQKISEMKARGVEVYIFPPVMAQSSFAHVKGQVSQLELVFKSFHSRFVVPPRDYAFPDYLFYDTPFHMTRQGAVLHSNMLAGELKRVLQDN